MSGSVTRLKRVRKIGLLWCVELLSVVTGRWIVASEWSDRADAYANLRHWA